jgi:hypothetical protein
VPLGKSDRVELDQRAQDAEEEILLEADHRQVRSGRQLRAELRAECLKLEIF